MRISTIEQELQFLEALSELIKTKIQNSKPNGTNYHDEFRTEAQKLVKIELIGQRSVDLYIEDCQLNLKIQLARKKALIAQQEVDQLLGKKVNYKKRR